MTSFRASNRITRFRLFSLREEFVGGCLSLFGTLLFHLLVDPPLMAERIDDLAVASAPEHVLYRHAHTRAGGHGAGDNPVCIVNQEGDAHARSPERQRRLAGSTFTLRKLVADEKLVPVQSQFAVHELLAARLRHSMYFFGAKDALVKVERGKPAVHDQFGDELVLSMHGALRSALL